MPLRNGKQRVEWLNADQAIFYAAAWGIGFLAAVFASLDTAADQSFRKCFTLGGMSGFLAFASVALFVGRISEPLSGHWYYLGLAALIGLSAKQQEKIKSRLIDLFFKVAADEKQERKG